MGITDTLAGVLETLNTMNAQLLRLSAEVPGGKTEIKELLGAVQSSRGQLQEAIRGMARGEEESGSLGKEMDRYRLLLQVAEQFHSTLDTDAVAVKILDSILGWIGAERGLLLLQDPATGEHLVKVGRELNESVYQSSEVAIPRRVVGQVLKEKRAVYSTDVQGDPKLMAMASVRDLNVRSLACAPLIVDDEVLGVVYFDYQAAQHRMGEEERRTLEAVCDQAALALMNANRYQRVREWARKSNEGGIGRQIGTSEVMRDVFELINQVALSPTTSVLLTGASGTGKELAALAIHDLSSRAEEPFVAVNCAALPATLLESELFGYEKGAFTDAKTRKRGLIEQADGGTLFLDEIAEMSAGLQSKLLRVLEDRTIRRLGGEKDIKVDVRVIAATNREIEQSVRSGEFRADLYYRLNVFPIHLPPLKERGEDVILIANAVIEELNGRLGTRIEPLDPRGPIAGAFRAYEWPGNVRELRNVLERAMILSRGRELKGDLFPEPIDTRGTARGMAERHLPDGEGFVTLEEMEEAYMERVLGALGGDKKAAAKVLGINPSTLYRKEKQWVKPPGGEEYESQRAKGLMGEIKETLGEAKRLRKKL